MPDQWWHDTERKSHDQFMVHTKVVGNSRRDRGREIVVRTGPPDR
jgi:hypothetical protein